MCQIYATTEPNLYATTSKSIRINGHVTSIRLENEFWNILTNIATESDMTITQFINTLHNEVLELGREIENFASLLRVICTVYLTRKN